MTQVKAVWEQNEQGVTLYPDGFPGAFSTGKTKEEALAHLKQAVLNWCVWSGKTVALPVECEIVGNRSGAMPESEQRPMSVEEFEDLKRLCMKSAGDLDAQCLQITMAPPCEQAAKIRAICRAANEETARMMSMWGFSMTFGDDYVENRRKVLTALGTLSHCMENAVTRLENGTLWSVGKVMRTLLVQDRKCAMEIVRLEREVLGNHCGDMFFNDEAEANVAMDAEENFRVAMKDAV